MASPRLLITGGSGYLGRRVGQLARPHWAVAATYCRRPAAAPEVQWHPLDVRDRRAVDALLAELAPEVVVHTAALLRGPEPDLLAVNAAGSEYVARAARAAGARLVHISTDVLFDGERGSYSEEDPPNPITPYGRSKARAEALVRSAHPGAVVVRTSLIYDWRSLQDRQTRWMVECIEQGRPLRLFSDERRCPIWLDSLAAAVVELAGLDYSGLLHVAGGQALSRLDFGLRLLRFHGLDTDAVIPSRSSESGQRRPRDCTLDCSRARRLLHSPLPGVNQILREALSENRIWPAGRHK
ncbi:MAG: SDR family oxidoreductase [Chloroflexia bacterium]|nr:SDR family oxidoreductase [Chloroflexia bacterium]